SIEFSREANASAGAGMMMLSDAGGSASGMRSGGAGNQGQKPGNGQLLDVEQALRRETVEANKDASGDNVTAEVRRKTEQSHATAGFTRAAAGAFDHSRVAAPPPVPEASRAKVQAYFIRQP